ncbi:MAG TPA: UDP-2,4-diacetamido-2,4,6-trideoxy-beta-L-altropyranose hydrolase [Asticcacaulis sp.]|nr:UDP-2,4-diacetamido-2,4,6-trideoxy-beta-L-altropyranose hydrolase [Asticcacaulis sp.]
MRLFFRTEASSAIGMGHFMRCFAIAEEARLQGLPVTFLLNSLDDVRDRLESIGADGVILPPLGSGEDLLAMSGLGLTRRDGLVVDSYAADDAYIAALGLMTRVCVIDDLNLLPAFDCDLIVNAAEAATHMDYARKTRAKLLLGANYALIRQEFRAVRARSADMVTLMFGGSDPQNLSAQAARLLIGEGLRVRIIAGPANRHIAALQSIPDERLEIVVSPPSVAEVLADSALVVTAAGGSVGEVAAMGLPALVLVVYDNQAAALTACPYPVIDARQGLPNDLGAQVKALLADPAALRANAERAHALVDGLGARRIIEAMRHV